MKKVLCFLIAAGGAMSVMAQSADSSRHRPWFKPDSMLSRWVLDVNLMGGLLSEDLTVPNTLPYYTNSVNSSVGDVKFKNGYTFGGDAQIGYFFGRKSHFGFGTGIMYLYQQGDMTMDRYHVEYQSTDGNGNTFRQLISSNGEVKEHITTSNINIPLLLKYKKRFTQRVGFTADAGILYNIHIENNYKVDDATNFDYEAIYKYSTPLNGLPTSYDNSPTPGPTDLLITKSHFMAENKDGNANDYFNSERALGYNVGLNQKPTNNKGSISYLQGSVGFLVRPAVNIYLSDRTALTLGLYYLFQPFNHNVPSDYKLTNKVGEYNSVMGSVTEANTQSYGLNVGLRFYLGNKPVPTKISYVDQSAPSACGVCDGSFTLYGLPKGKNVEVDYSLNGLPKQPFYGTVDEDGAVKVSNLCSGYYGDIVAKMGHKSAMGAGVVLADPTVTISMVTSTNPTAPSACDGTITIRGSFPKSAIVNYSYNGNSQSSANGHTDASDNTIVLSGLCDGTYKDFVLTSNNCTANGSDVTLTAPKPTPPPTKKTAIDLNTPILFETAKASIHESSYDVLEEAVLELNDNPDAVIVIDGHTDDVGTASYNRSLSNRRADAVKQYLLEMGINPKRLLTVGHGDEMPVAPNQTAEGRAKNRRVIMTLKHRHE